MGERPKLSVSTSSPTARPVSRTAAAGDERAGSLPVSPVSPSATKTRQDRAATGKPDLAGTMLLAREPGPSSTRGKSARTSPAPHSTTPHAATGQGRKRRRVTQRRYSEDRWAGYLQAEGVHNGDASPPAGQDWKVKQPASFIEKLYDMLASDSLQEWVHFTPNGDSFLIPDTDSFSKNVLPLFFPKPNFPSFMRAVHGWGFTRTQRGQKAYEIFAPACFRRGQPGLLAQAKRKGSMSAGQHRPRPGNTSGGVGNGNASHRQLGEATPHARSAAPATPASPPPSRTLSAISANPPRLAKGYVVEAGLDETDKQRADESAKRGDPLELTVRSDCVEHDERDALRGQVEQRESDCVRLSKQLLEIRQRLKSTVKLCQELKNLVEELSGTDYTRAFPDFVFDERFCDPAVLLAVVRADYRSANAAWPSPDSPAESALVTQDARLPRTRSNYTLEERAGWQPVEPPSFPPTQDVAHELFFSAAPASHLAVSAPRWPAQHASLPIPSATADGSFVDELPPRDDFPSLHPLSFADAHPPLAQPSFVYPWAAPSAVDNAAPPRSHAVTFSPFDDAQVAHVAHAALEAEGSHAFAGAVGLDGGCWGAGEMSWEAEEGAHDAAFGGGFAMDPAQVLLVPACKGVAPRIPPYGAPASDADYLAQSSLYRACSAA